jgi:hypothetical protein
VTAGARVTAGTVPQLTLHQADRSAGDGEATPGGSAGRGATLMERGHVHARFGGIPVLVTAEMAAQIKAFREVQP